MVSFKCSLTRANSSMACFPDAHVRDALSIPNTYITHTKADADDRLTDGSAGLQARSFTNAHAMVA